MNSIYNSEIGDIPFLYWGDYDKLAGKYPAAVIIDPSVRNKYIKDLRELQVIANEATKKYQEALHSKRISDQVNTNK